MRTRAPRVRIAACLCLAAVTLSVPIDAVAQEELPPNEAALFLLLPIDPKAIGLGRAMTAMPGSESVWWNPAGLSEVRESRAVVYRGEGLAGDATGASVLLASESLGLLGVSYQLLDAGSTPVTDPQGNELGTITFREHLGIVSVASRLWDRVGLGVNLKIVQSRFSCRGQCVDDGETGTTFAVDAGIQTEGLVGLPLRLGVLLAHAGPDLQVVNEAQADPLPTRIRGAIAYEVLDAFLTTDALALWLTVELDDRWRGPGDPAKYFGAELQAGGEQQLLSLRAGYTLDGEAQVDGAAVGLGLRYDRVDLAIAKSLASQTLTGETEPVHISFGFVF